MGTRRMVLYSVYTHLSRWLVDMCLFLLECLLCVRPFWIMEASCLVEVPVSRLCWKVPLGPSVCMILDLPCSSRKLFRVAVRCFLLRLSQFSPFLWLKEAEVHRAVAEGVLRGTSSSSTIASPHEVAQSS